MTDALLQLEPPTGMRVVFSILIAFALGLLVTGVYRLTSKSRGASTALSHTLVILATVTAIVILVIGSNLARAFGLVGALSIIRFRTVVKDNRDTAFVFFALAAGLAAGAESYRVALIGVPVAALLVLVLFLIPMGGRNGDERLLKLEARPDDGDPVYRAIFDQRLAEVHLLHVRSLRLGQLVEMTFHVRLKDTDQDHELVAALSALDGIERVSLAAAVDEVEG